MRSRCLLLGATLLAACAGRPPPAPAAGPDGDAGPEAAAHALEEEEVSLEGLDGEGAPDGGDPIGTLIASLDAPAPAPVPAAATPPAAAIPAGPTAREIWAMTDAECAAAIAAAGIATSKPDFATPLVGQPLLLDGPIDGVAVRPKWRRAVRVNEVMDCRLIAALRGVAAAARAQRFAEVLFYSTYRPIREPPAQCPDGAAGKRCRAAQAAYRKALAGKASMHRRALAIDVGWLTTTDGTPVEVLTGYERHAGAPPCAAPAQTDIGRRLRDFACALHAGKLFNVVLTPNANKAHHNHFHFDITPDAGWYIVR